VIVEVLGELNMATLSCVWFVCVCQKSAAYSLLAVGFSLTAWLLQYIRQNIQSLLESYLQYFILYFTVAGVISFAVCYYKGPVTNPRLHNLIKWFIQLIAIAFIYNSSYIPELSATIFIAIVVSSYVPLRLPVLKASTKFW
jgi:NEMP family